jgi:hypothetical protein
MSDSLSSGQPLYLLYSYSNFRVPAGAVLLTAAFATQATGNVRLHVTGNPPTTSAFDFFSVHESGPSGRAPAASPSSTRLREGECPLT